MSAFHPLMQRFAEWGLFATTLSLLNFFLFKVLPGMTQLTRKSPIALRLILRGSPGPTG